jgi:uncharacterized protein (DUF427 family)
MRTIGLQLSTFALGPPYSTGGGVPVEGHSAPIRRSRAKGRMGPAMTSAHRIEIAPFAGRVRVRVGGEIVADTAHALLLAEGSLPPVFYVPRGDVHMERLEPSPTTSRCPFKGDASYYGAAGGPSDVAWSYESPIAEASAIAGHLAFYPDKAEVETLPFG